MKEITKDTLLQFEKLLIEIGGVFKVQDDYTILNIGTNQPVAVVDGKKSKIVAFFYEGMRSSDNLTILNPFKECVGINRAREWFYNSLSSLTSLMLKQLMEKMIRDAVEKKDDNYSQFPLMSRIIDKADATMIDELDKVRTLDLLTVYYNKKNKSAEAQCAIQTEEYQKDHPKYRKKTWEVFDILINTFLGTDDMTETYSYTAKILAAPETDAKLHVIVGVLKALDPWCRDLLGINLHGDELEEHLDALEGYVKLYAFVTQTVAEPEKPTAVAPWNQNTPIAYNNPTTTLVPAASYGTPPPIAARLVPTSSYNMGMAYYGSPYAGQQPMVSAAAGPLGGTIDQGPGYHL